MCACLMSTALVQPQSVYVFPLLTRLKARSLQELHRHRRILDSPCDAWIHATNMLVGRVARLPSSSIHRMLGILRIYSRYYKNGHICNGKMCGSASYAMLTANAAIVSGECRTRERICFATGMRRALHRPVSLWRRHSPRDRTTDGRTI